MKKLSLFLAILALASCGIRIPQTAADWQKTEALYLDAVEDAAVPTADKVYDGLVVIDAGNPNLVRKTIDGNEYILFVSWKGNASYYKNDPATGFYNTGKYEIWVSAAPQLLDRIQKPNSPALDMRLKQLLGLPPKSEYNYFVEFWVRAQDLFRPCPDAEVTDSACGTCFPDGTDQSYKDWIDASRISRYYPCDIENKYPWTELGYTYDWNPRNKTHVGLSEFVIKANVNIQVKDIYTTEEYFEKNSPYWK